MSLTHSFTCTASSPALTDTLAETLSRLVTKGDVILLNGDLGAGKTHFARALIRAALLVPEDIPSPTFTLVQTYPTQRGEIWHADLYRLSDIAEIEELGLLQAFEEAICLIEWPDRLGELKPKNALNISLIPGDDPDARCITFSWTDPRWNDRLETMPNV